MGVNINSARQNELAAGINCLRAHQIASQDSDALTPNPNVRGEHVTGSHHSAIPNDKVEFSHQHPYTAVSSIADTGHTLTHSPHPTQRALSTATRSPVSEIALAKQTLLHNLQ